MKAAKLLFSIIFPVAWPLLVAAQASESGADASAPFNCTSNVGKPEADSLIGKVQERYDSLRTLKAKFLQRSYLAALDQSEISTGQIYFSKPGRMKWVYEEPKKQTFIIKDNTLWLYQEELNQVVIEEFDKVLISDLPVAFLMGIGNLKSDFSLLRACRNQDGLLLELAPKSKSKKGEGESQLRNVLLLVDGETHISKGALVSDVGSNTTSIVFSRLEPNSAAVRESDFAPGFPSGADVADHRTEEAPPVKEKDL